MTEEVAMINLDAIASSVERAATALEAIADLLSCTIEVVPPDGEDNPTGATRCTFRVYDASPFWLQNRSSEEAKYD